MSSVSGQRLECAICLDNCLNAVRLHCNHVFCYLCVKGSAQQSNNRCPVCRRPIPTDYFDAPNLIKGIDWKAVPASEGMQWQYEGRNGWWLYDSRTSRDIEKAFEANESNFEVLIAGFVYVIDFEQMIQFRRIQPNRIRKIRRHIIEPNDIKGVAGLRANFDDIQHLTQESSTSNHSNDIQCPESENSDQSVPQLDSNDSNEPNNVSVTEEHNENVDPNSDINQLEELFEESLNLRDDRQTYL